MKLHESRHICHNFILATCLVMGGVALYPNVLGQAAASNNEFVFGLFLVPFFVLLFFAWIGEKIVLKVRKRKEKTQKI